MVSKAHWALTGAILGAYYEVYNHTSRTYPEFIYERALREELRRRGLSSVRQDEYEIRYKGRVVGRQRLDLFVVNEVVVEIKVAAKLTKRHKAQAISYIKTVGKEVGLLLNFGGSEPEHHRLYFDPAKLPRTYPRVPLEPSPDWLYPELAYEVVGGLFEVHGLLGAGFVYRIYANACTHEMQQRALQVLPNKRMAVHYKGAYVGDIAFAHLIVEDKLMLFPLAIGDLVAIHLDHLKGWMQQCGIDLGLLANFDTPRLQFTFVRP